MKKKLKNKVSVSELKAHALQIIETVKTSKKEVEVYKRGKLVARIVPASDDSMEKWWGCLAGTAPLPEDPDDILKPIDVKWDADS